MMGGMGGGMGGGGTTEEWVLRNSSSMDHPFHLDVWPFRVLDDASGNPVRGWKDTVNVPAGQSVRLRVAFRDLTGRTVYHCHILDHEDLGMMGVIDVEECWFIEPHRGQRNGEHDRGAPTSVATGQASRLVRWSRNSCRSSRSASSERWRLEVVRDRVEAKLAELAALMGVIDETVKQCDAGSCPLAG